MNFSYFGAKRHSNICLTDKAACVSEIRALPIEFNTETFNSMYAGSVCYSYTANHELEKH
jgi:hypothetical protein